VAPWRRQDFSTQIVDVGLHQLLYIVPGRSDQGATAWLEAQGAKWREQVRYATLDLSSPYRLVFTTMLPDAVQVADPFRLASAVCAVARRGQGGDVLDLAAS